MTKKKAKKTTKKKSTSSGGSQKVERPYPRATIEDALKIVYAIKDKNGGNPWAPAEVAKTVGMARMSNPFFYMAASARDFGLTMGSRDTATISLTPLGKAIAYAPDSETEVSKKREAFLKVEVFGKVLEYYKGSDLPEMKYLGNTLTSQFGLHSDTHKEFSKLFRENVAYLGIESGFSQPQTDENDAPSDPNGDQNLPTTVTLAEPSKASTLVAFVIMPFKERDDSHAAGFFQEVLRSLITPAGRDAGFNVRTANRQGSDVIQSTII